MSATVLNTCLNIFSELGSQKCFLCHFCSFTIGELRRHINEKHGGKDILDLSLNSNNLSKSLTCPLCKSRFLHRNKLTTHCISHTTEDILKKSISKFVENLNQLGYFQKVNSIQAYDVYHAILPESSKTISKIQKLPFKKINIC
jgi:hypothetical protein